MRKKIRMKGFSKSYRTGSLGRIGWKRFIWILHGCFDFFIFYTIGIAFYSSYEDWDFEDCVNFITQTVTTVGYGDIVPTSRNARWFTCFYCIFGILLVYSALNDVVAFMITIVRDRYYKIRRLNRLQVIVRSVMNVIMWFCILFLIPVIGAIIFGNIEGWDFHTAFYFSVISSTSVGFGDYVITQRSSIWINLLYLVHHYCLFYYSRSHNQDLFVQTTSRNGGTKADFEWNSSFHGTHSVDS